MKSIGHSSQIFHKSVFSTSVLVLGLVALDGATLPAMRVKRRNDATAALIGCQILSVFFARYDFGKKAIRTLAVLMASKKGKIAGGRFPARGIPGAART
jgi:hypothetical protein